LHRSRSFDGISEVISRGDSNPDATVEAGVLEAVDQEAASVEDAISGDVTASVNGLPGRSVDVSGFNDVVARSSGSGYRPADSDISTFSIESNVGNLRNCNDGCSASLYDLLAVNFRVREKAVGFSALGSNLDIDSISVLKSEG
jgi:hypothetical protein